MYGVEQSIIFARKKWTFSYKSREKVKEDAGVVVETKLSHNGDYAVSITLPHAFQGLGRFGFGLVRCGGPDRTVLMQCHLILLRSFH
jgi:hypothetical protein